MCLCVCVCGRVLDVFDALVKRRGSVLSAATWERIIRLLLGAADSVLHSSKGALGTHLCGQLTRILFEIYLRSLPLCGPKGETWSLLQKFCRRWIHRHLVIEQWNAATLALTKSLMKQIHAPDASKEVEIVWAENRIHSKFEYVCCRWRKAAAPSFRLTIVLVCSLTLPQTGELAARLRLAPPDPRDRSRVKHHGPRRVPRSDCMYACCSLSVVPVASLADER